jgi:glutamate-ammonia-ligase adenylyltransferase
MQSPSAPPRPDQRAPEQLLDLAGQCSRFLRRLREHPPRSFDPARLDQPLTDAAIGALLDAQPVADEVALLRALREVRRTVMLHLITRDLTGLADLAEVMHTATALAEHSVRFALSHLDDALGAAHGHPVGAESGAAQHLHVVAMGKLGGAELNVSSDIDLIFLYPEEGQTGGSRPLSAHEYFTQLGRKLINALAQYTADGHVFRVDMRLRPYGDSGPLAMSFAMLENYLHTQGREWERYAWVKAREITGRATP